jgi:hypothetical protein
MCYIPWDTIGKISADLLTPLIAVVVAYVAVQQYKINRRQYRLALIEKRLVIYNAVLGRIVEVINDMDSTIGKNIQFIRETRDHEFLFGPEVGVFINSLWKRGNDLMTLKAINSASQRQTEVIEWFDKQRAEARAIFFDYIDLTDKV